MSTKQKNPEAKRTRRVFAAREKCEAVLAVWAERRKPGEICRELEIPWQLLNNWQDAAMKGMMQALEPRQLANGQRLPALSPRIEKLLVRADVVMSRRSRAEARLASIQKKVDAKKTRSSTRSPNE